jgi:putative transposase
MSHPEPDVRRLVTRRLLTLRQAGRLTSAHVQAAARAAATSERTVWRWLQDESGAASDQPRSRYTLTETDWDAYAAWRGSAAAAWRQQRTAGAPIPSLRTFQMAITRELLPGQRAAMSGGVQGRRRHTVYLRWEATYRNQLWQADHKELPVLTLAPKARRPRKPWVTLLLDAYSRLVMGWAIAPYPSSATVLTALRMAIVVDAERGPFGGVPDELWFDGGLEFAAKAVAQATGRVGCTCRRLPAYSPHLKGKIERYNRTVGEEFLRGLPFYTDGPRAADGRLYGPDAAPLTLRRFAADFGGWVRAYNTERPHQGLAGMTPLARWLADATPIQEIPKSELRWLLLAGERRIIGRDGIRFGGHTYIAPELHGRGGEEVEVRWMPHDPREIEVFYKGTWLTTAKPQGLLTPEERDQVLARRKADADELARRHRRASRRARRRLAPVSEPSGEVEEVTAIARGDAAAEGTRRHDERLRRLARTDLLDLDADPRGTGQPRRRSD